MLWTPAEDGTAASLMATVGNGHVAWPIGWAAGPTLKTMYIAGVFNGVDAARSGKGTVLSHRAAVTSPLNLRLGSDFAHEGAALDLRGARYLRRSRAPNGGRVEQRWYAHRSRPALLVSEVVNIGDADVAYQLSGGLGGRIDTTDIDFTLREANVTLGDGSQAAVHVMTGATREVETVGTQPTTVSVVATREEAGGATLASSQTHWSVAAVVTSLESQAPEADALRAYAEAYSPANRSTLAASHAAAWAALWRSGVELHGGRRDAAVAVNASLYYLLSSVREDVQYSLSPGGLASNGYNGHSFWDCETWMFPPLLMWHPPIARSLLAYREARLPESRAKARSYTPPYAGAMFAWESAVTGAETCPVSAPTGQLEQHITGDVAFAARQYYEATGDVAWASTSGFALVSEAADFWVSKVARGADGVAHINKVIPPDEYACGNDSVYTNTVARITLDVATAWASLSGKPAEPACVATLNLHTSSLALPSHLSLCTPSVHPLCTPFCPQVAEHVGGDPDPVRPSGPVPPGVRGLQGRPEDQAGRRGAPLLPADGQHERRGARQRPQEVRARHRPRRARDDLGHACDWPP